MGDNMQPLVINLTAEQIEDHMQLRRLIIAAKKNHLSLNATPDRDVHFMFPEGNFTSVVPKFNNNAIQVYGSHRNPSLRLPANGTGWMRFIGQGPEKTIITVEGKGGGIGVRSGYRISFEEMGFKLGNVKGTTTQGHITDIVAGSDGHVDVRLEDGFPTPTDITDPNISLAIGGTPQFRRYDYSSDGTACHISETEEAVTYSNPMQVSADDDRSWRFGTLSVPESYRVGDLVAFKDRLGGARGFIMTRTSNVLFKNVRWYQKSEGVYFRQAENFTFDGCSMVPDAERFPKPTCLASADGTRQRLSTGGIMLGVKGPEPIRDATKMKGIVIKNFVSQNNGGAAITIFHGEDVVLENISIRDVWGDGIYLYNTTLAKEENVSLTRANLTTVLGTAASTPIPAGDADAMPTDSAPTTTDTTPTIPTTTTTTTTDAAPTPTDAPTPTSSTDGTPTADDGHTPQPPTSHGQAGDSDGFNPLYLLPLLLLIPLVVGVFFFLRTRRSGQSSSSSSPRRTGHDENNNDHQQHLMSENHSNVNGVAGDEEEKSHQADMTTLGAPPPVV